MDGEIEEPSFHRLLEKEELELMETEAKNLYYRAHTIGDDLLIYWSNRSDFINDVRTGDVSKLVELKHRYYISFDSGMMESAYERYASGNNEIKRIVANLIKKIAFRDVIRPDIAETNTSINHLRILKMRIEDLKKRETDSFVDVYHTHFISVLDDKIKQLEAKKRDYM
ncbi:MAG: hypothetical protein IKJ65_11095 [Clostridia bacterium]|nr:hypothetical protein [Clostridia bacterium]